MKYLKEALKQLQAQTPSTVQMLDLMKFLEYYSGDAIKAIEENNLEDLGLALANLVSQAGRIISTTWEDSKDIGASLNQISIDIADRWSGRFNKDEDE